MTVHLPQEKVDKVLDICETALQNKKFSIRYLAHVVGTFQSYSVGVDYGLNHIKLLQMDLIKSIKRYKGDFDAKVYLSDQAKEDIRWWQNNVKTTIGRIRTNNPDFTLTTDASNTG